MSEPDEPVQRQMELPLPRLAPSPLVPRLAHLLVAAEGGWGHGPGLGWSARGPLNAARPFQIWQGIDIETKMHVRFLNMETIALCH